ncbi:S8 family peptidase [Natranaerobius thermophilus]|nr:S8 family serine peptidase [Natranaerobius thermophilus]
MSLFVLAFLLMMVPAQTEASGDSEFVVTFEKEEIDQEALEELKELEVEVNTQIPQIGVIAVEADEKDFLEKASQIDGIEHVTREVFWEPPEIEKETFDQEEASEESSLYEVFQWDIKRVTQNEKAWDITRGDDSVTVGVIDTGIDADHPDLKENLEFATVHYEDAEEEDAYVDPNGHGTHVAGSIAADGEVKGVGPDLGLASFRVMNDEGVIPSVATADAIATAADKGVDVVNISLGALRDITDEESRELYHMTRRVVEYADDQGMIMAVSAGNDSRDLRKPMGEFDDEIDFDETGPLFDVYSYFPDTIAVSASDIQDNLASYSNYGQARVDLGAPGGDFNPEDPEDPTTLCLSTYPGEGYAWMAGTSMASPKAAAVAGLIISENPGLSHDEVITQLKETAETIDHPSDSRRNFGHGLVNSYEALKDLE